MTCAQRDAPERRAVSYRQTGREWWGEIIYTVTFDNGDEVETTSPSEYASVLSIKARP